MSVRVSIFETVPSPELATHRIGALLEAKLPGSRTSAPLPSSLTPEEPSSLGSNGLTVTVESFEVEQPAWIFGSASSQSGPVRQKGPKPSPSRSTQRGPSSPPRVGVGPGSPPGPAGPPKSIVPAQPK